MYWTGEVSIDCKNFHIVVNQYWWL